MSNIVKTIHNHIELPKGSAQEAISVGDIFVLVSHYTSAIRVIELFTEDGITYVKFEHSRTYDLNEWEDRESKYTIDAFMGDYAKYLKVTLQQAIEFFEEADKVISGEKSLQEYNEDSVEFNENTALMGRNSDQYLNSLKDGYESRIAHVNRIKTFVMLRMEKKKAELEEIKSSLNATLVIFQKKIKKIMNVIASIELYLGIGEDLFQIQEGPLAPADTPIVFRQQVLYMDEEIGHWKDGGLDFTNIEWFDKWLIKDNNFKKLIEEKGVVVFSPRRHDKKYNGYDPIEQAIINRNNKVTYLLIRNGENLYRIYTDHITIKPRLFPRRSELQELMTKIKETQSKGYSEDREKDELDDLMMIYKKRALLMQGLIDRTEILHPLPSEKINIFELDELGDKVKFIYDDEATLPSGRKTFREWRNEINDKIGIGSRILIMYDYYSERSSRNRYYLNYRDGNTPNPPSTGVYEVEGFEREYTAKFSTSNPERIAQFKIEQPRHKMIDEFKNRVGFTTQVYLYKHGAAPDLDLTILYNPKDKIWGDWSSRDTHERKNRLRYAIFKNDSFILNYDQIDLDDINFYLNSRIDRPNYLEMMPVLENIKIHLLEEKEKENEFAKMVFGQLWDEFIKKGNSGIDDKEEFLKTSIQTAISWWKFKNKWKRGITKDDAKAMRMIIWKLKKEQF